MRKTLILVVATAGTVGATAAQAQARKGYDYVARTVAPVARAGMVTAGSLQWTCSGNECRISGHWPTPGVAACAALAAQVGRIAAYGRSGAMLTSKQLIMCNEDAASAQQRIDPNALRGKERLRSPAPDEARGVPAPQVSARPLDYVASMDRSVGRINVTARDLPWSCSDTNCRSSDRRAVDSVVACTALRDAIAATAPHAVRVKSFSRDGVALAFAGITACNAAAKRTPSPSPGVEVVIEPGGRPEDMKVHVLTPSVRFYGVTAPLPAPALPPPTLRVDGGRRLETGGVRLQASAPGAIATLRSSSTSEAPAYRADTRPDAVIRVPVLLQDMPADVVGIGFDCALFTSRHVPRIDHTLDPAYAALSITPGRSENQVVAEGHGEAFIRSIGRFEAVFEIPLQTRPFLRVQDARSYLCNPNIYVARPGGGGRDRYALRALVDPASSTFRESFRPAAGTTPVLTVEGNIQ